MASATWFFLGSALALLGAVLLLAWRARRANRHGFDELADAFGWDHQPHAPDAAADALADVDPRARTHRYLAGPSRAGPFQMFVTQDATWVHLRTTWRSKGIAVLPRTRFARHRAHRSPARDLRLDDPAVLQTYDIMAFDTREAMDHISAPVAALLLRPQKPLHVHLDGRDAWVRFPLAARGALAVVRLMRYAEALGLALEGRAPGPAKATTSPRPVPAPTATPQAEGASEPST